MTKVDKDEVLHIAKIARVKLYDGEIDSMSKQLDEVLSYAERVQEIAAEGEEPSNSNVNTIREDVIVRQDASKILEQAPAHEEDYFIVPAILEN